jgi:pimeloyl-ACP methyl ester carboxylesterase
LKSKDSPHARGAFELLRASKDLRLCTMVLVMRRRLGLRATTGSSHPGKWPFRRRRPSIRTAAHRWKTSVSSMRQHRPPTLVVWGRYDPSFISPGAEAYRRDVADAEIHLLDAGHFALEEKLDEIATLMLAFLQKQGIG